MLPQVLHTGREGREGAEQEVGLVNGERKDQGQIDGRQMRLEDLTQFASADVCV